MAQISGANTDKIYTLSAFLGLNEAPDGDTKLKLGEAAICRNWKVTPDKNLQRRPGLQTVVALDSGYDHPVRGLWTGYVNGVLVTLAACNGKLYQVYDGGTNTFSVSEIASLDTANPVHFFGFEGKAYVLNGKAYKEVYYTGSPAALTCTDVVGYIPLVSTNIGPDSTGTMGGETLEQVNKLIQKRRAWLSPDGGLTTFSLPENKMTSIDYVKDLSSGSDLTPVTDYTYSTTTGQIFFTAPPAEGVNTYEVGWTMPDTIPATRNQVARMRYSEMYSGAADNRVFLYGDGSNELLYSGMDYNGKPRADYFPDNNEIAVGDENTPITGAIRHYSRLIVYKIDSTWVISQSTLTLADGSVTAAFYVTSVNKAIGNEAPGQVMLVLNSPRTLFGGHIYEWRNNSSYTANLTVDERQARRISDRVNNSLRLFNLPRAICWDDNDNQEYYVCYNGNALVHNYAADAWYVYDNFHAECFTNIHGDLYIGTGDGRLMHLTVNAMADDGEWVPPVYDEETPPNLVTPDYYEQEAIDAYWESGSISYNLEWGRKYSSTLWVSVKPQTHSYVEITAMTDRKPDNVVKTIAIGTGGFANLDFNSFVFDDYEMPQVTRLRIKAKKFTYYKLIFQNDMAGTVGTVLSANMRVRQTGYVK